MKKILIILLFTSFISCKTVYVNKQNQRIAATSLELATIGTPKANLLINNFEVNAIPQLHTKIRVSATQLPFTKSTYKAYSKATTLQGKSNTVTYIDSLPDKPTFITLKIIDKVTLLNELSTSDNSTIYKYLKSSPNSAMINSVSVVFDLATQNDIQKAEELYLVNSKYKKYDLELYRDKQLFKTVEFTQGTVFTYQASSFCWKENERHQVKLDHFVDENSSCKNNAYNSYQKAEAAKEVFKF